MNAVYAPPIPRERLVQLAGCVLLAIALAGCATSQKKAAPPNEAAAFPPNQLFAGMAEVDITPPIGFRMAGYFNERFATATHDPLKAKALVLRQEKETVALVFCDLVGPSLHVTTNARALAGRVLDIPITNIVIAATHSHTGPLFDDVRGDYFHETSLSKYGADPHQTIDYPAFLTDRLVKVIARARARLEPVELEADIAKQAGLPFNRRYYMKDGHVAFNPGILNSNIVRPAGPVDSDVGILIVKSKKWQQPVGGLTVFAMHCDTVGGTEFSADYPYYIEQTLRSRFSQSYISAFGAGTCGDLNHIDVTRKQTFTGFENTERIGSMIGETIVRDLGNLKPIEQPSLASRSTTLILPMQTVTPEEVLEAKNKMADLDDSKTDFNTRVTTVKIMDLARRGAEWPMEVQVFRLNADTAIVCLPAEIFVEFGLAIKKASPFSRTFVISICNDRPAYVPTLKAFSEGSYEVINSRLKPGGGEAMTEAAIKMLNELKEQNPESPKSK